MSLPVEITSLPLKKVVMEEPYVFPPERARSPTRVPDIGAGKTNIRLYAIVAGSGCGLSW